MLTGGEMQIYIKNREVVILLIVSLMAFTANLPEGAIGQLVDRNLLLVTLVVTVVIALFRYLRLMLFLTVSVLAIGANLPDQLASQLGISQLAMIVASGVLVIVAALYKLYHLRALKSESNYQEDTVCYRHDTFDSRNDVITAILTGNIAALHQLLIADVEINFSQNGHVPLYLAIEKGYADIVLLLLFFGAKLRVRNKAGQTPLQYALLYNNPRVAKIVHYASRQNLAIQNKAAFQNQQKKVAVLFADICGSTALYDKLGNETALNVITRTLNILIQEVAVHKGILIKTIGDEIMCTFPSVAVATQAACAMHSAIDAERPGGEYPVFIRIGFHYGEVIHKANDVFGDTVNVAARVAAITRARQIMTTQTVVEALPYGLEDKVRPVTRAAFHGKQDSLAVFQILWGPENTFLGRIGDSILRKKEADNEPISDIQAVDHLAQQLDLQAQ
jgi:class 3 adenylate cyclase